MSEITIYKPSILYSEGQFLKDYAVVVQNGRIIDLGNVSQITNTYPKAVCFNWKGYALLPGTVNVHNHSFQSLLRGLAADRPFLEWRSNALYRYSPELTVEDIYWGAVFAFSEMMLYGVTTVCDFFYLHTYGCESDEAIIRAAHDVGIRLVLARTMYDWNGAPTGYRETISEALKNTKMLYTKYEGSDFIRVVPAPHSLHAASPDMIRAGYYLAKELNTPYHIHVAEEPFEVTETMQKHGLHTIEYLDKLGVVDESMVIVHGVWLEPEEIQTMGEKGVSLAYCPSSNMFLADGITDIPAMIQAGVITGLGTDGACSNNRISVFEEMRMTSLLQKAHTHNALCVNYKQTFDMGTKNGGKILRMDIGEIKKGYYADFVGIDLSDLSLLPISPSNEQVLPNIVYSMQPGAVAKVVIGGKETVSGGILYTGSKEKIRSKVQDIMSRFEHKSEGKEV